MMRGRAVLVLTCATVSALIVGLAAPAFARETATNEMDTILAAVPGGSVIDDRTISWNEGTIVLTLAADRARSAATDGPAVAAVGSCPTGSYCVFDGASLTGSRLAFTTCGTTQSTAALPGSVRSLANARSSGTIAGQNSAGSTLSTVAAGGSVASAPAGIVKVRCTN